MSIAIRLNGKSIEVNDADVVADLLRAFDMPVDGDGMAVAINGEVVPKREWPTRVVRDGDVIEIIRAVQGG